MGELGDDPVAVVDAHRVAVSGFHPVSVTTPAAGASIGLPIGAETSIPSCGRAKCRIGCVRIEENALVSQPWVGMIEGVAARRAECVARLSAASPKERASRLARRISPSGPRGSRGIAGWPASRPHRRCRSAAGPPTPAACTWGSIGSRLASTRIRASRCAIRLRVSVRVARRPVISPISAASRTFSWRSRGALLIGGAADRRIAQRADGHDADGGRQALQHAVGDLDDFEGSAVRNEHDGPAAFGHLSVYLTRMFPLSD